MIAINNVPETESPVAHRTASSGGEGCAVGGGAIDNKTLLHPDGLAIWLVQGNRGSAYVEVVVAGLDVDTSSTLDDG